MKTRERFVWKIMCCQISKILETERARKKIKTLPGMCMAVMVTVNKHLQMLKDGAHQQALSPILYQDQMMLSTRFPQTNCHRKFGSCILIVCEKVVKKQDKEAEKK